MVESPSVSISFSQDLTAVQLPKDIAIGEVRMVRLKLSVPRSWKQYKMTNDPDAKTCCSWWSSEDSGDGDVLKWKWVQLTCLLMRNPIVELYVCISCRVICLILYFKQKYIYIYMCVYVFNHGGWFAPTMKSTKGQLAADGDPLGTVSGGQLHCTLTQWE